METTESGWKIATVLPGALLVAVACSQIYLTQANELTPSKGGGFGMFAVTDLRSARTWSAECLTDDGQPCRILIPRGEGSLGQWLGETFRTMPSAAARARAADRVFAGRYVLTSYEEAASSARLEGWEALLPPDSRTPLYRQPSTEDLGRGIQPLKLRAVRFEAWRLAFDPATHRVSCQRVGEPELRGRW